MKPAATLRMSALIFGIDCLMGRFVHASRQPISRE
jgi:hypothetical protein